jgi:hypothetical protein
MMDLREEDFRAEIVFGFGCGGVETWSGEGIAMAMSYSWQSGHRPPTHDRQLSQ